MSIRRVVIEKDVKFDSANCLFGYLENMTSYEIKCDMSTATSMVDLFNSCKSIEEISLSGLDLSNVTSFRYAFNSAGAKKIDLSGLDMPKLTSMRYAFCSESLEYIDFSGFSAGEMNDFNAAFYSCSNLEYVDMSGFHVSTEAFDKSLTAPWTTFYRCNSLKMINLGESSVKDAKLYAGLTDVQPPTYSPYTGKWVKQDDPKIVLTSLQLAQNYPDDTIAPKGTYVWQTTESVIEFDGNVGETSEPKIVQSTPATITLPDGSNTHRTGYVLAGWNTSFNGQGKHYAPRSSFTPQEGTNNVLFAEWVLPYFPDGIMNPIVAPLTYHIEGRDKLDRNGIYDDPNDNNYQGWHAVGMTVDLTDIIPTRRTCKFVGWSSQQFKDFTCRDDAGVASFLASDKHITSITMPEGGASVYAVWQEMYSRELVNGDYSYPTHMMSTSDQRYRVSVHNPFTGEWLYWHCNDMRHYVDDYSLLDFGWIGSQTNPGSWSGDKNGMELFVEIQADSTTGNPYGELGPNERFQYVYQEIITSPGAIYTWRLDHSSRSSGYVDKMAVEIGDADTLAEIMKNNKIGADAYRQPVTRIKSNGTGALGGCKDNLVATNSNGKKNIYDNSKYWETYTGIYVVPDGQYLTRFQFREIDSDPKDAGGNHLDNVVFSISYPITFNLHGGTSSTIYSDPIANNYQGYHTRGDSVTLPAASEVTPPTGYTFLGWADHEVPALISSSTEEKIGNALGSLLASKYPMPASSVEMHAVYAESASINIEENEPSGGEVTQKGTYTPTGSCFPTFEYEIAPSMGHRIARIYLDDKLVSGTSLDAKESYDLVLEDVIGHHDVRIEYECIEVTMPHTGSHGSTIAFLAGVLAMASGTALMIKRGRQGRSNGS